MKIYKKSLLLSIVLLLLLQYCSDDDSKEKAIDKDHNNYQIEISFEEVYQDSVDFGREVSDSFLDYKLGENRKSVELKTSEYLKAKKLSKTKRLSGSMTYPCYNFSTENYDIPLELLFFFENDQLSEITLIDTNFVWDNLRQEDVRIYNYSKYYKEILDSYKSKYTSKWFDLGNNTYSNIDGTRMITVSFKNYWKLKINYTNIRVASELEKQKMLKKINEQNKTLNDI